MRIWKKGARKKNKDFFYAAIDEIATKPESAEKKFFQKKK